MSLFTENDIIARLVFLASNKPTAKAFSIVGDKNDSPVEEESLTYYELLAQVKILASLIRQKVNHGDRAIICLPPGLDYVRAFYACLYAGVVAVPLFPPLSKQRGNRIDKILENTEANHIFSNLQSVEKVEKFISTLPASQSPQLLLVDSLSDNLDCLESAEITDNEPAFLQYTSGSTGSPKGVMVFHRNIIANLKALCEATGCNENDIFVNWLPLFHDLGLINTVLLPVYLGATSILIPPTRFIQSPELWLDAISKFRGTICGAPNFAYDHCSRRVVSERIEQMDLGSWRIAFNAGEIVRASTLRTFADKFKASGFNKSAFYPSYGMAESTVFIAGGNCDSIPVINKFDFHNSSSGAVHVTCDLDAETELVGNGRVQSGHHLKIVNPEKFTELEEGFVGEIWIAGPSVSPGYWNTVIAKEETFRCGLRKIANSENNSYLRTGDLGFVWNSELYITGRLKELIVIHGQNFYPTDIEDTIQGSHRALVGCPGAAFSVEVDGDEKLVVVQEIHREYLKKADAKFLYLRVTAIIAESFEIGVHDVIFVRPASIPKTSSGKIQRILCKDKYVKREFESVAIDVDLPTSEPRTLLEQKLVLIWREVLNVSHLGIEDNFFALGGNSLSATVITSRIRDEFQIEMPVRFLFEYPTIADFSKALATFEDDQILPPIRFREDRRKLSLSYAQQRMWFIDKLYEGGAEYNIPGIFELKGELKKALFEEAIQAIVMRHEVIRTNYVTVDGVPEIKIRNDANVPFEYEDISHLSPKIQTLELEKLATRYIETPFDLAQDLLVRVRVIKFSDEFHTVLFYMHHIVSDGWSLGIFVREFSRFYDDLCNDKLASIESLKIQYADYSSWQREWLAGSILDVQLGYWARKLANIPQTHDLPLLKPRSFQRNFAGCSLSRSIDKNTRKRIRDFCQVHDVTPFMFLQTAFSLLLSRYSAEDDIVVGSATAGRTHSDVEPLIGLFANTLVIRTIMKSGLSFLKLLQQNKKTILDAYRHQHVPFEMLVEELQPERSLSHHPIFQIMFSLRNIDIQSEISTGGLILEPKIGESITSRFDIELHISDTDKELSFFWLYNPELFAEEFIEQLAQSYQLLLLDILDFPETDILEFDLVKTLNQLETTVNYSEDAEFNGVSIQSRFENISLIAPSNVAASYQGEEITYQSLNEQANQLARYLVDLGVMENCIVGICVERSLDMIVGMLAILKAGGAYLPLDPEYPQARLKFIVQDSDIGIILTQKNLLEELVFLSDRKTVLVDFYIRKVILKRYAKENLDASKPDISQELLAYVIYTSGSTGRPKGVLVDHSSVLSLFNSCQRDFSFSHDDVWAFCHSYAFDFSVWEIWGALLHGARVAIVPDVTRKDANLLYEFILQEQISILSQTPSSFYKLLDCFDDNINEGKLAYVIFGGDILEYSRLATWYDLEIKNPPKLVNMYGITETTVHVTHKLISSADISSESRSVGVALGNATTSICNEKTKIQPLGVKGELLVAGLGVARGYLNQPELTRDRFIPNTILDNGSVLYRSGDLARQCFDGSIEHLGRMDHQVKIRGYRIELAEITSQLLRICTIREAIVHTYENGEEGKHLVVYVVPTKSLVQEGEDSQSDQIGGGMSSILQQKKYQLIAQFKKKLAETLPTYMIPEFYVFLDYLPLTENGKIDYDSLPPPDENDLQKEVYIPPENEVEKALCVLWQEILQIERIGVQDNFFNLGGHSLLAVELSNLIKKSFGQSLPLKQLFETPTIAGVAEYLSNQERSDEIELPAIVCEANARYQPFPLTGVQQAYLLGRLDDFELGNIGTLSYTEINIHKLDVVRLTQAWNQLIKRHDMLRTVFDIQEVTQRTLETVPEYIVEEIDLSNESSANCDTRLLEIRNEMFNQVFSVERWPLFDIRVSKLTESEFRLHCCQDALIFDATSARILLDELFLLYTDSKVSLPTIDIFFRDYVYAEELIKTNQLYEEARSYWLNRLCDLPAAPELPYVKRSFEIATPKFKSYQFVLGKEQWLELQGKSRSIGVTPTVFIASLFSQVLGQWSKKPNFTLNLTLFNRLPLHEQVHLLVGDFTSLTLLEIQVSHRNSLADSARSVQRQLWSDLEHRYFGGTEVLRALNAQSESQHNAGMPVVFTSTLGVELDQMAKADPYTENSDLNSQSGSEFVISQTSQVWLDHIVGESEGCLTTSWMVLEELFPEGMVDEMFGVYRELLTTVSTREFLLDSSYYDFSKPRKTDNKNTYGDIRDTSQSASKALIQENVLLHELFHFQVEARGKEVAMIAGGLTFTYEEVCQLAITLAAQVGEFKVKPNELVAIVMEKGWEQVVSVLSVLYAGAAYLPIDVNLPEDRIRLLLDEGDVRVALTQTKHKENLSQIGGAELVCVDYKSLLANVSDQLDWKECQPKQMSNDLAYVIFTSGSTGSPKGVMVDHAGVVNTIKDINRKFEITHKDRVLALSSLSFDLSVYDIFGTLAAGGALIIPDAELEKDVAHWAQLIEENHVTIWNSVPALAQLYIDHIEDLNDSDKRSLRLFLLSGDWIAINLAEQIKVSHPISSVISLGGATEASIWSIFYPITSTNNSWKSIPYGKPLCNQSVTVLTEDLLIRPIWAEGELYIGGLGLSHGYWKDTNKTNENFIIHPDTGERLYKTGDMGRYMEDGIIEFLGREDSQVKVQGHRIELGEIEYHLSQHKNIRESVVSVFDNINGKYLVGYVVPEIENDLTEQRYAGEFKHEEITLIHDPVERSIFKLEERGLKRIDANQNSIVVLPKVETETPLTVTKTLAIEDNFEPLGGTLAAESIGGWLSCLRQVTVDADNHALSKRYYPSAGTLYPIQVFLHFNENIADGVSSGFYYYDPKSHQLIALDNTYLEKHSDKLQNQMTSDFSLFMVVEKAAIIPFYGQLSERFGLLEVGHISHLLKAGSSLHNLMVDELEINDAWCLPKCLGLGETCEIVKGISVRCIKVSTLTETITLTNLYRQSFREYLQEAVSIEVIESMLKCQERHGFTIYAQTKMPDSSIAVSKFYRYCWHAQAFEIVGDSYCPFNDLHSKANDEIYKKASLILYFVTEVDGVHARSSAISAGELGQALMHVSPEHELGLCPLGDTNIQVLGEFLQLNKKASLLYTLAGGKITLEQTKRWPVDETGHLNDFDDALRNHLSSKLPSYMVPATFIALDRLPLNANGKVDRSALPAPGSKNIQKEEYTHPRNEIERKLCELWSQVLKIDSVGIYDSLFSLGGDSVTSIQIVSRAGKEGLSFKVKDLFESQCIAELSSKVEVTTKKVVSQEAIAGELPLHSELQELLNRESTGFKYGYDYQLLEAPKELEFGHMQLIIKMLLDRHDALRIRFESNNGKWKGVHVDIDNIVVDDMINYLDLSELTEVQQQEALLATQLEAQKNLGTTNSPIFSATYLDCGEERKKLLLASHYLLMDSVSWKILVTDIGTVWHQIFSNEDLLLPPKTDSFQAWNLALRSYAKSASIGTAKKFWQSHLTSISSPERGINGIDRTTGSRGNYLVEIDEAQTQSFLNECNDAYKTQVIELLIVVVLTASRDWSDKLADSIIIEDQARKISFCELDISQTIGSFVSRYPLVTRPSISHALSDLSETIKTLKKLYRETASQGMAFEAFKALEEDVEFTAKWKKEAARPILIRYLDSYDEHKDSDFAFIRESVSRETILRRSVFQSAPMAITAQVVDGRMIVEFSYEHCLFDYSQIEKYSELIKQSLSEVILHCHAVSLRKIRESVNIEGGASSGEIEILI